MKIRFLHAADLHLDTPFKGVRHFPEAELTALRNSTFEAFSTFIQYAVNTRPDFVVLVGDIYDGEHRSLRAQLKFQEGMVALKEAKVEVFLSYGNHDHLQGMWTRFDLPDNVHVFAEEVEEKSITVRGEKVSLYGFSYPTRHVRERMIDAYPVADNNNDLHIGLLHGSIDGDASHAVYAPFTKEALLSKRYAYWALGHIHKRQALHEQPPIIYPGNLQGRHRNEQGEKGFYDVTIEGGQVMRQFIATSTIIFDELSVSCEGVRHVGDWLEICEEALENNQAAYSTATIVTLRLTDIDDQTAELFRASTTEEWLDVLRDKMRNHSPFIWVNELRYDRVLEDGAAFQSVIQPIVETIDAWTVHEWDDVLKELYAHTRSIPYLERLTSDDLEEIQVEVEKTLRTELSRRG